VLFIALIALGLFVPLIEELLKPIGVMLLLGRPLTPAQGFALGALSGAGYALVENLMVGVDAETWAFATLGRFGTSVMHIFTAALSGYALVRAKNGKRYLQLAGIYLLNVLIHGVWNSLVILTSATIISDLGAGGSLPSQLVYIAPVILVLIAATCLFLLRRYNRRFASAQGA
jgi:RsiW-degrading membrane proteinase PrsW (M82 family)